jgi:hypothetical protein
VKDGFVCENEELPAFRLCTNNVLKKFDNQNAMSSLNSQRFFHASFMETQHYRNLRCALIDKEPADGLIVYSLCEKQCNEVQSLSEIYGTRHRMKRKKERKENLF